MIHDHANATCADLLRAAQAGGDRLAEHWLPFAWWAHVAALAHRHRWAPAYRIATTRRIARVTLDIYRGRRVLTACVAPWAEAFGLSVHDEATAQEWADTCLQELQTMASNSEVSA